MTTTDTTTDTGTAAAAGTDTASATRGELCWLPLDALTPHPENPRASLGDLSELVRSIRSHGILEPLVVLPANDNGEHLLVAGHRRHAAAQRAGTVTTVPVVVRAMTPVEVIEAMLSENVNRSDLTVAETSGIASDATFDRPGEPLPGGFGVLADGSTRRQRGLLSWGSTTGVATDATMLG
jgi:hypothetical protein